MILPRNSSLYPRSPSHSTPESWESKSKRLRIFARRNGETWTWSPSPRLKACFNVLSLGACSGEGISLMPPVAGVHWKSLQLRKKPQVSHMSLQRNSRNSEPQLGQKRATSQGCALGGMFISNSDFSAITLRS